VEALCDLDQKAANAVVELKLSGEQLKRIADVSPVGWDYGMWVVRRVQEDRLRYV